MGSFLLFSPSKLDLIYSFLEEKKNQNKIKLLFLFFGLYPSMSIIKLRILSEPLVGPEILCRVWAGQSAGHLCYISRGQTKMTAMLVVIG